MVHQSKDFKCKTTISSNHSFFEVGTQRFLLQWTLGLFCVSFFHILTLEDEGEKPPRDSFSCLIGWGTLGIGSGS